MIKEAMQEGTKISSTRLVLLIDIIACIGLAFTGLFLNRDLAGIASVIGALLLPVSIMKGAQKFAERGANNEQELL